ncbi:MAG TPA: pyridoxamine 5'-phosphate oxidase family protein [Candidatus Omnitrophica bacterium]|nr:pyridoxamine 5'-phosphate oxidase family protein [Candidatus Omnitrophota bacterium]
MIPEGIRKFIKNFSYGFLGTADLDGKPNISIKGIVDVDKTRLYFFDLFKAKTRKNLEKNSRISFFVIDWDNFIGYQLKGKAQIVDKGEVLEKYMNIWENKRKDLIISRILDNIKNEKVRKEHSFSLLKPQYLIIMDVEEIYDLVEPIKILVKTKLDGMNIEACITDTDPGTEG